ncbi:hypothetical protein MUN81_20335 [Hymenobacter sp. 5317J-9]|uniref:hypothetical protein n=1 Tax=Hymenobacter sp. 5317J-9 TaxID=2932250 RepID=UPI001FD65AD9|nr:hypothetical protein [Hymenobacter sp. 5317J-9]UOQ97568.1 hypothetical protein MUN81_20335 [Hymenobacter sp. 5317J-9]
MSAFGLEITPRPDLPAIVARWQREITAPELQAGYFAILEAADALGCWRWLLDLRRRDELATPELTVWMNAEFFPQLPGRYPEPVRLAFLVSPLRALQQQSASSVAAISAAARPDHGYLTALFTEEAAAYQWLGG